MASPQVIIAAAVCIATASGQQHQQRVDAALAQRFANLALDCVHREYPNKIAHVLQDDGDARPPRELTPAFYGCYDWHSAVHGHWLLVRLLRLAAADAKDATWPSRAREALDRSLTDAHIAAEVAYLQGEGRASWERPYGLAWLLQLSAELHDWDDPLARRWARTIEPLEQAVAARLATWLPKLTHPNRSGEHSQTAFALGLMYDWADSRGATRMRELVASRARDFHLGDRGWPLRFEPSGQDFLSPGLAPADLLRRILPPEEFAAWLGAYLPDLPLDGSTDFLRPAVVSDPTDGKLAHLDGLNLSRAWMLEGIATGLPAGDPRRASLQAAAAEHLEAGLAAITGEHYAGGHWLGSFAVYATTRRGL